MIVTIRNIFTGKTRTVNASSDLVAPWCLDLKREEFVRLKVFSLMQKIFNDCYRYSTKMSDTDMENSLFDTVVYKDAHYGLISKMAELVAKNAKCYLVYDSGIVREATVEERKQIDQDYSTKLTYQYGIILDFTKYSIGRLLAHYFHQIYTIEQANNNSISLGGSIQLKISKYRESLGYEESMSPEIQQQASNIVKYAKDGKPLVIDAQDILEQTDASKNITVADSSRDRCYRELAAAIGGPVSYITGQAEDTNGSGTSYERLDGRAEDMIKNFWITVFKPVTESLYKGYKPQFISQKWMTIKENMGSIAMIETLASVPDPIKASVIKKLIGDNEANPKDKTEQSILELLITSKENVSLSENIPDPETNEDVQ